MSPCSVAILGQGRSGYGIHVRCLTAIPELAERYRVALVCDPDAGRLADAQATTGCAVASDWRAVLERPDIDLVINATPSHLHVPITRELLEAGRSVLCEKPLARRIADVDDLLAAAKRGGGRLMIFQQSRFAPYFQQVCRVLDSGVLGRVVAIRMAFNGFARRWDWQTLQCMDGGNLLNTGPHPLDQALQLFGAGEPQILCRMDRVNTQGDAEDFVKFLLWGTDRPLIDLEISSCSAYPVPTYHIEGSCGGLDGDMQSLRWRWFDPAQAPPPALVREPLPERAYCSETLPWQEASWEVSEADQDLFIAAGRGFYTMIHDHLDAGAPLAVTPQQVRRQIAVIEECHRQNPLPRRYDA